tara:strand:- start:230 stop:553 length:324 start_codon:yes stop_codon:yes gene_type:complete
MIYNVRAKIIEEKLDEFYERLTDGTIENQLPDGEEIVSAMKRAVLTEPGLIEWFETCFCPTPLQHERETQYDSYFSEIDTELVQSYGKINGESFWHYMESINNHKER